MIRIALLVLVLSTSIAAAGPFPCPGCPEPIPLNMFAVNNTRYGEPLFMYADKRSRTHSDPGTVDFYANGRFLARAPMYLTPDRGSDMKWSTGRALLVYVPPGSYRLVAIHRNESAETSIVIRKGPSSVEVAAPAPGSSSTMLGVRVIPTLRRPSDFFLVFLQPAPAEATGTITVRNSDGREVGSATVVDGRANVRLNLQHLRSGPATLQVVYHGSEFYEGSSTAVTVVVPEPRVSIEDAAAQEGTERARVARVRLGVTPHSGDAIEVSWTTADGTAIAGEDYVASSGTARIAAGESGETIEIPLLADDKAEFDETFTVKLTGIRGATLGRRHGTVQITTDDPFFTHHAGQRYGAASAAMTLDLRVPRIGAAPHPILIGIEANGWSSPDANGLLTIRQTMRGYAVATVSFRPAREAPFPAQLDDLREAVRWLRANAAQFQLDPNRIGVWGIGYGGHLAALLGTDGADFSSRVQAVVDWYGPTDISGFALTDDEAAANVRQLLGGSLAADLARAASPATHASPDDPPFLIMHGMHDTRVPIAHSEALHRALRDAGVDANLVIVPLAGHGGGVWDDAAVLAQVDAFLDGHLLGGGVR